MQEQGQWGDDDAHGTRPLHYEQLLIGRRLVHTPDDDDRDRGRNENWGGESPALDTHCCEHFLAGWDQVLRHPIQYFDFIDLCHAMVQKLIHMKIHGNIYVASHCRLGSSMKSC
jgi:hypothetical protein